VSIATTISSSGKGFIPRRGYVLGRGFIHVSEKENGDIEELISSHKYNLYQILKMLLNQDLN